MMIGFLFHADVDFFPKSDHIVGKIIYYPESSVSAKKY